MCVPDIWQRQYKMFSETNAIMDKRFDIYFFPNNLKINVKILANHYWTDV